MTKHTRRGFLATTVAAGAIAAAGSAKASSPNAGSKFVIKPLGEVAATMPEFRPRETKRPEEPSMRASLAMGASGSGAWGMECTCKGTDGEPLTIRMGAYRLDKHKYSPLWHRQEGYSTWAYLYVHDHSQSRHGRKPPSVIVDHDFYERLSTKERLVDELDRASAEEVVRMVRNCKRRAQLMFGELKELQHLVGTGAFFRANGLVPPYMLMFPSLTGKTYMSKHRHGIHHPDDEMAHQALTTGIARMDDTLSELINSWT